MSRPIFEEKIDPKELEAMEQKIKTLVNETVDDKISKVNAIEKDKERESQLKAKLDSLKKKIAEIPPPQVEQHVHDNMVDCPTCKDHKLKIENGTAKCTGDNCGKEFLLLEKIKNIDSKTRKDYLCIGCGHTMTTKQVEEEKVPVCPLCNKNSGVTKLKWNEIDKIKRK